MIDTKLPGWGQVLHRLSLFSGADRIELYCFGPGGTNGDAWVGIPALRTLIAGDAFAAKALTLIDKNNGGGATGYLQGLEKVAAGITGVDTIIPGTTCPRLERPVAVHRLEQGVPGVGPCREANGQDGRSGGKLPNKFQGYNAPNPRFITGYIQAVFDETT